MNPNNISITVSKILELNFVLTKQRDYCHFSADIHLSYSPTYAFSQGFLLGLASAIEQTESPKCPQTGSCSLTAFCWPQVAPGVIRACLTTCMAGRAYLCFICTDMISSFSGFVCCKTGNVSCAITQANVMPPE